MRLFKSSIQCNYFDNIRAFHHRNRHTVIEDRTLRVTVLINNLVILLFRWRLP